MRLGEGQLLSFIVVLSIFLTTASTDADEEKKRVAKLVSEQLDVLNEATVEVSGTRKEQRWIGED